MSQSIALLVRSLNYGGAERQLVELASGLHSRGCRVAVMAFYPGGPLIEDLKRAGVRVQVLAKRGRWDVLGFFLRLVREVRREHPDLVYSFLVEPGIVAVVLKLFVPNLRVIWGVLASSVDFGAYDWPTRLSFKVSCWLARFADLIIVNSKVGAIAHEQAGYPKSRIVVLPSGVDVTRFKPDAHAGHRLRDAWGIPQGDKVIGIVGRLDPMKDHSTLFEAAAILRRTGLNLWWVCVGAGEPGYVETLRALTRRLGLDGRVLWAGLHADMVSVYNAFDIVCSSSAFGEGWSNALGEGMACGLPCVATDVGDAHTILGDLGVLVPSKDPHRLAEGIRTALTRSNDHLRRGCRDRIVQLFSSDRMITETERLLRMCVDASS